MNVFSQFIIVFMPSNPFNKGSIFLVIHAQDYPYVVAFNIYAKSIILKDVHTS